MIGIPDEAAGELPMAFVVRKPGKENLTQEDVINHVKGREVSNMLKFAVNFYRREYIMALLNVFNIGCQ